MFFFFSNTKAEACIPYIGLYTRDYTFGYDAIKPGEDIHQAQYEKITRNHGRFSKRVNLN